MPVDLPLYNKLDGSNNSKRPKQNKRYILAFALIGICFIFYLNARLTTTTNPDSQDSDYTNDHYPFSSSNNNNNNNNNNNIYKNIEDTTKTTINNYKPLPTLSPHSKTHKPIPQPFDETKEDITINESNHYNYLIVIASNAKSMERRRLIREKYFGLRDNLLPCMRYNSDVYYKFWIYGGPPASDTPLRRQFEAEKMEWNDFIETDPTKFFDQVNVLQWAEGELKDQGITYDYLILQDINTFIQLDTMKRELDSGVISENTDSPFTINTDAPTNFVWGNFRSDKTDKGAIVIGSRAVQLALLHKKEIEQDTATVKGESLITSMYKYYQTYDAKLPSSMVKDPEQEAIERGKLVPDFVREDGPDGTHRFIRWENNVESVHSEDIVVYEVYQDLEFAELARQTRLKPVNVCYRKSTVTHLDQAHHQPMDDDEDALEDLLEENHEIDEALQENENQQQNNNKNNNNNKQYDASSIAVVTSSFIYDACMEPSATRAAMNKRAYALKHGYSFVARSAEFAQEALRAERKTVWGKVDVIEKVLPKYEWIFWLDMDAVVMDQNRRLEDLLEEVKKSYPLGAETFDRQIDLVIARPHRDPMINAGVFLMRNTPWSMQFLRDVQKTTSWYNKGSSYEQGAMWDAMQLPENKANVYLLDRDDHTFNTFPKYYLPGDFVVHFAPDKCPNDATVKGLNAADRILKGQIINRQDLE